MTDRWPAGPYPEFEAFAAAKRGSSRRSSSTSSAVRWISKLFARSPNAINEKRERLLPKSRSSSRSNSTERSSMDIESQASTLLEFEREKKSASRLENSRFVADAIIGLSDGLTVPFALTAGLSCVSARPKLTLHVNANDDTVLSSGDTKVVIFAGLAELTAGAISMGLGGYLAATSEEDSYKATLNDTCKLVTRSSEDAALSIRDVFEPYDLPSSLTDELTYHLSKSPNLVQFLMHFQHNAPEQTASRALSCALTIASGYFMGGFLPLIPYFLVGKDQVLLALYWSFAVMAVSLFSFGYGKTCFVAGWSGSERIWAGTKSGLQMMLVGGTAAICAMSLVRLFDSFAT